VPKDLSVIALRRDGSDSSRWNFFDCVPTLFHPFGSFSPESNLGIETLTIGCGRVELTDSGRTDMTTWINDTMEGGNWKRTVVVTEIEQDGGQGRTYTYVDAFPVRYVFPSFSSSGTGYLYEELTFKPIRLELD